jgi:hypothetical protein
MLYEVAVRDLVCRGWTAVLQLVPRPSLAWQRGDRSCLYREAHIDVWEADGSRRKNSSSSRYF